MDEEQIKADPGISDIQLLGRGLALGLPLFERILNWGCSLWHLMYAEMYAEILDPLWNSGKKFWFKIWGCKDYLVSVRIVLKRWKKPASNKLSYITILLKKLLKECSWRNIWVSFVPLFFSFSWLLLFCLKFFMQQYRLDYSWLDYDFLFERIFMFIMQRSLCASDCLQWLGIWTSWIAAGIIHL